MDEFADALAELEDPELVVSSINWSGSDYPCFVSGARKGATLQEFGFSVQADVVVIIRGAVFSSTQPTRGQTFIHSSTTYRIDEVLTAPAGAFLRIAGVSASRGQ